MKKLFYLTTVALCMLFTSCKWTEVEEPALALILNRTNVDVVLYGGGDSLVTSTEYEQLLGTIIFSEDGTQIVGFEDAALPNAMIDSIKIGDYGCYTLSEDDRKILWNKDLYKYMYDSKVQYTIKHTTHLYPIYYFTGIEAGFLNRLMGN